MVSSLLALLVAASSAQASDTTRSSREAFTTCLRAFVDTSARAQKTLAVFEAEYPQACAAQQTAFRESIIRRDTAMRATRSSAEESANLEVEDARINFSELFQMSIPAQQQAQAAPPAEVQAQVQPASQPQ